MPPPNHHSRALLRRTALSLALAVLLGAGAIAPDAALAAHRHGLSRTARRGTAVYHVPAVTLRDLNDHPVALDRLMAQGRPVVLEFFFTSCPTICGLQNSTLAAAQAKLAAISPDIRLISISIDPGFDTPARLRAYAKPFHPLPNWRLLTGRAADITRVMSAFHATYPGGNKYLHQPLIYVRAADTPVWRRIDGLLTASQLVAEYRDVIARAPTTVSAR